MLLNSLCILKRGFSAANLRRYRAATTVLIVESVLWLGLTHPFYTVNICAMKKVTIMEAQHNLSKVLRSMGPGDRIAITRNKKIVAELAPPLETLRPSFPDFAARAKANWGERWIGASSQALVDDSRGER